MTLPIVAVFVFAHATAILVAYRHGLRASELVTLHWDDRS